MMCWSVVSVLLLSLVVGVMGDTERVDPLTNLIETRNSLSTNELSKMYCILDYIYDQNVTQSQKRNQWLPLDTHYYTDRQSLCPTSDDHLFSGYKHLKNSFVLINYSNECDINEQIDYFRNKDIYGLFVAIDCSVDIYVGINISSATLVDNRFTVSLISNTNAEVMVKSKMNVLKIYILNTDVLDNGFIVDYSMACMWLLATFTVCLGAFWSGGVRLRIFMLNKQKTIESKKSDSEVKDDTDSHKRPEEEAFINLSPFLVLAFVVLMASMLLLLYYFFQYLVYVIICLFTLASIASLFACLEPLVLNLCPKCVTKPSFILFNVRFGKMFFYQLVLLVLSISLAITWFVYRRHANAWLLQDLLGICFCLNMLRTIRLPSYKICVILLYALFFYDIFFVFITPLITSKGNSVMVDVATGGGSGRSRCGQPAEQLPMVMRISHSIFKSFNNTDSIDVCHVSRDSLLGFGDILVPGLLVSYCYAFDLIFGIKYKLYYISTCIGYGLGLIATFAGLYLMSGDAQPALLYLVPFTTIPPILIALYRKELSALWLGPEAQLMSASVSSTKTDQNSAEDSNNLLIVETVQQSIPQNSS